MVKEVYSGISHNSKREQTEDHDTIEESKEHKIDELLLVRPLIHISKYG